MDELREIGHGKGERGMNFHDLESFNMALLVKQGWRLTQSPESFMAKIFKEKYFSTGNFLDSSLGNKPSYAWRSIWNVKKYLQAGMMWRVGDGRIINIWNDRWPHSPPLMQYKLQQGS